MIVKQTLKALFLGTALLALSAQPAAAQTNVSGGFALVHWGTCCAYGFMADLAHAFHSHGNMSMAAVGDFGWTRFGAPDSENDTTYTGGLRATFMKDSKAPVHAQVLLGGVHWTQPGDSDDEFIIGVGGGTIIKVWKNVGVKPQGDFFFLPGTDGENNWFFRFSINAVIPIGK